MRAKVLVTRRIAAPALDYLANYATITLHRANRNMSRRELEQAIGDKDGIVAMLSDSMDREMIGKAARLKVISLCASGSNNVDLPFARERGIVVTNTPDALKQAVADLTWALILGCARRVPDGDREMRECRFKGWAPLYMLGHDVHGKTLGIMGMGRIGCEVAKRARGFGMRVVYHNRNRLGRGVERETRAMRVSFERLVRESDFLVILAPLTPETRHRFREPEFRAMKPNAYLINVGRGPIVEERALVKALRKEWIAGAGLDVYEFEPAVGRELRRIPNAVLLPHVGSATIETRARMSMEAVQNVVAVLGGRPPISRV
ncbi:MAG: D-glycerate dehydrogenase [Nitrospirae bacterium]|nr:D-glycerate dehydrogenase [Nitrospirota bacterium]